MPRAENLDDYLAVSGDNCLRPGCEELPIYLWGGYCSGDCVVRHRLDTAEATIQMLREKIASADLATMMLRRLIVAHYREKGWDQGDKADRDLWTVADAPDWSLWIDLGPPEGEQA